MFTVETAPVVLSEEQIESVHAAAMTVLEEVGTNVDHEGALELLREAGQAVDGNRVRWDREFVMEMVERAPGSFSVHSRNPQRTITVGGGSCVLAPSGGSPFVSDLDDGRRDGTIADHDRLVKLAHTADLLTCLQGGTVEASDLSYMSRHMDMDYSCLRWSDKPYVCYGTSGPKARDAVELAAIANGGHEKIAAEPAIIGVVNSNSPLVWDDLMVGALLEWARANQPIMVTPFLLVGGTAPVSIAGSLAMQVVEALTGVALAQLVRPGVGCVFGSFLTALDMRTGSPAFGAPESMFGTIAGAQLARHYKLPFRGGGGLVSSNAVDAQAASETMMMLWSTKLAATDFVLHAAGWLEGGLVTSLEKMALDLELLTMFRRLEQGIGFSEEEMALDAIREVGPGGLFLAADHTLEHYKQWLTMSPVFLTASYETWKKRGMPTAEQQANAQWKRMLESYEDPGLDEAIDAELGEYIGRRRTELGDD